MTPKSSIQLKKDPLAKTSWKALTERLKSRLKKEIAVQGFEPRGSVDGLKQLS